MACLVWVIFTYLPSKSVTPLRNEPQLEGLVFAEIISLSDDEIHVLLINNSEFNLEFSGGRSFVLEQYRFFRWREMSRSHDFGYTLDIGVISAQKSSQFKLNLQTYQQSLTPGVLYRLRMNVWPMSASNTFDINAMHSVVIDFKFDNR